MAMTRLNQLPIDILTLIFQFEGTSIGLIRLWTSGCKELCHKLANGGCSRISLHTNRLRPSPRCPALISELRNLRHLSISHRHPIGLLECLQRCAQTLESLELTSPNLGRLLCPPPQELLPSTSPNLLSDLSKSLPRLKRLVLAGSELEIDFAKLPPGLELLSVVGGERAERFERQVVPLVLKALPRSLHTLNLPNYHLDGVVAQLNDLPPTLTHLDAKVSRKLLSEAMHGLPHTLTNFPKSIDSRAGHGCLLPRNLRRLSLSLLPSDPTWWERTPLPNLTTLSAMVFTPRRNLEKADISHMPRSITELRFSSFVGPDLDLSQVSPSDFPPNLRVLELAPQIVAVEHLRNLPDVKELRLVLLRDLIQPPWDLQLPPSLTLLHMRWLSKLYVFYCEADMARLPSSLTQLSGVSLICFQLFALLPPTLTRLSLQLHPYPEKSDWLSFKERITQIELPRTLTELKIEQMCGEGFHAITPDIIKTIPQSLAILHWNFHYGNQYLDPQFVKLLPRALQELDTRFKSEALSELPPALTSLAAYELRLDPTSFQVLPRGLRQLTVSVITRMPTKDEICQLPPKLEKLEARAQRDQPLSPELADALPASMESLSGWILPESK